MINVEAHAAHCRMANNILRIETQNVERIDIFTAYAISREKRTLNSKIYILSLRRGNVGMASRSDRGIRKTARQHAHQTYHPHGLQQGKRIAKNTRKNATARAGLNKSISREGKTKRTDKSVALAEGAKIITSKERKKRRVTE